MIRLSEFVTLQSPMGRGVLKQTTELNPACLLRRKQGAPPLWQPNISAATSVLAVKFAVSTLSSDGGLSV